jgi:hypothetical protein
VYLVSAMLIEIPFMACKFDFCRSLKTKNIF